MEFSRRTFLNKSAVTVVGSAALAAIGATAFADVPSSTAVVPMTPLAPTQPPPPAAPEAAAPTPITLAPIPAPAPAPATVPVVAVSPEGIALSSAAIASAGYQVSAEDAAEVNTQLGSYPAPVAELRAYKLSNGVAPCAEVTPRLRPQTGKTLLNIKL